MKKQKKKTIKTANPPYADQLDDDGKPTGNVIIKFKSKAAFKPAIFDAKGGVVTDAEIWSGSEIRVNAAMYPYFVDSVGAGVSLKLRAVQIIKLVEGSEGAGRFGFEETSGYTQAQTEGAEAFTESTEEVKEPEVVKSQSADDDSKDVADIVSKWGAN